MLIGCFWWVWGSDCRHPGLDVKIQCIRGWKLSVTGDLVCAHSRVHEAVFLTPYRPLVLVLFKISSNCWLYGLDFCWQKQQLRFSAHLQPHIAVPRNVGVHRRGMLPVKNDFCSKELWGSCTFVMAIPEPPYWPLIQSERREAALLD